MLVRWRATQSQLQRLRSTGLWRSLATSPSGKKPSILLLKFCEKIEGPAPPGRGVRHVILRNWVCSFSQGLIQARNTALSLAENEQEPQGQRAGTAIIWRVFSAELALFRSQRSALDSLGRSLGALRRCWRSSGGGAGSSG